jgi:hypothetical protein
MSKLVSTTNIANKVKNMKLPRTQPLMPLFEAISNSIHAINEAKKNGILKDNGKIKIELIRNGNVETLKGLENIDIYPIKSIRIIDNGIGLNDENLNSFTESDTDHKISMGGKGIGRFVCLKAFKKMIVKSCFLDGDKKKIRSFDFLNTKEGFDGYKEEDCDNAKILGTSIELSEFREEYQKHAPTPIFEISRAIISHFQLYFLEDKAPKIIVHNQNNNQVDLANLFKSEFFTDVQSEVFNVGDEKLTTYLIKSTTAQSHKIHFCAHNRSVREEGLANKIIDLGKYSIKNPDGNYYYQAFVVGDILDKNVDSERVGFNFPNEDDEESLIVEEITLAKVRRGAIACIENMLATYLNEIREQKLAFYQPIIERDMPQYRSTFKLKHEEVKMLPPNLTPNKLDIELYKIESNWKLEVKEQGIKILAEKKDITNLQEYKEKYDAFLTQFNEVGQSELARYIVHRKAVIELLDKMTGEIMEGKFTNEDIIHSIFFPIRTTSDEIPFTKQNLWLIDEKLNYHSFLASDKSLGSIKELDSTSKNRNDLIIFNDALAFAEEEYAPFSSFTIVEFKKPQRDDYVDYSDKENPLEQTEKYIEDLLEGKVKNRKGREIKIDRSTPFYVYIICDIGESLEKILKRREFFRTPDGQGYYKFKNTDYCAYFEVIPFDKVLKDAKKRNSILFEKLGISAFQEVSVE